MNKQSAIEFSNEFIENFLDSSKEFNLEREINVVISKEAIQNDPNLSILKSELNKINFDIFPSKENSKLWSIKKLN